MTVFVDLSLKAHPQFRLVLPEGSPFPAATRAEDWMVIGKRDDERLGDDAVKELAAQGYSLFRVNVPLAEVTA